MNFTYSNVKGGKWFVLLNTSWVFSSSGGVVAYNMCPVETICGDILNMAMCLNVCSMGWCCLRSVLHAALSFYLEELASGQQGDSFLSYEALSHWLYTWSTEAVSLRNCLLHLTFSTVCRFWVCGCGSVCLNPFVKGETRNINNYKMAWNWQK